MTVNLWSQTAASNASADPSINWAEGQAPSSVNNSARAMMAAIAKLYADMSGNLVTAGTSTAYTLSTNQVFGSLTDGLFVTARMDETNGAAATLNVDGLGAKAIANVYGTALPAGTLMAGSVQTFTYDSTDDKWIVRGIFNARLIGEVADYAGDSAPSGWLLCYGQAVSRTTYAALYAVLSTTYGVGDGSTTFNLPDCRGRVVAGQDDMGGSSANRLTAQTGGLNGDTLGATGGTETHTLTSAQIPGHTHSFSATSGSSGAHRHYAFNADNGTSAAALIPDGGAFANKTTSTQANERNYWILGSSTEPTVGQTSSDGAHTHSVSGTSGSTGDGGAHNNVQPTIILNKIIYAGV
jgi:microcystin-dependent protein